MEKASRWRRRLTWTRTTVDDRQQTTSCVGSRLLSWGQWSAHYRPAMTDQVRTRKEKRRKQSWRQIRWSAWLRGDHRPAHLHLSRRYARTIEPTTAWRAVASLVRTLSTRFHSWVVWTRNGLDIQPRLRGETEVRFRPNEHSQRNGSHSSAD